MITQIHINYPENEDSDLDVLDNLYSSAQEMVDDIDEEEELNESDEESSFL